MKVKFLREQSIRLENERKAKILAIKKNLNQYINNVDLNNEKGLVRLATALWGEAAIKKYFQ